MLKLKVCGLTDPQNIKKVIELEPDMIGLIFYSPSKRDVSDKGATELCEMIPSHIKRVGVFVDSPVNFISDVIEAFKLDVIQLYHDDMSSFQQLRSKVHIIKAISISKEADLLRTMDYITQADLFLFDTKGENPGGNGKKFDWRILQNYEGKLPFIVSGGIDENDADAIKQIQHAQFYGIDINSKFETKPGLKNIKAIQHFKKELYANIEHAG